MTVIARKYNLINQIVLLSDEELLVQLEAFFKMRKAPEVVFTKLDPDLLRLAKPLRKKLDIEQLKKEQNYKGVNRKRFDRLVKEMDIKESAEELIQMLVA